MPPTCSAAGESCWKSPTRVSAWTRRRWRHANWRLDNPPTVDVAVSRRMGLFVVGRLAARHGIRVRLRPAAAGGLVALVWLPDETITNQTPGTPGTPRRGQAEPEDLLAGPAGGETGAGVPERGRATVGQEVSAARTPRFVPLRAGQDLVDSGPLRTTGEVGWPDSAPAATTGPLAAFRDTRPSAAKLEADVAAPPAGQTHLRPAAPCRPVTQRGDRAASGGRGRAEPPPHLRVGRVRLVPSWAADRGNGSPGAGCRQRLVLAGRRRVAGRRGGVQPVLERDDAGRTAEAGAAGQPCPWNRPGIRRPANPLRSRRRSGRRRRRGIASPVISAVSAEDGLRQAEPGLTAERARRRDEA